MLIESLISPPTLLAADDLLSHVLPHELLDVAGLNVTNQMLMTLAAAILVMLMFGFASRRVRTVGQGLDAYNTRGRFPQLLEVICVYLRENVARPNLGDLTDKYIYYIWSVFFFILTINLVGMLPVGPVLASLAGAFGANEAFAYKLSHAGGNANSNVNMTAAMATLSLIAIVYIGVREQGVGYFKHFAPVPFKPWPMIPLAAMLIVIEVMGLLIKCLVLAMRLFGTMLAGHLVLAALIGLAVGSLLIGSAVMVLALAISLLELFIVFLQAFIFTFLTVLFIAAGAAHHDDHGHEHDEAEQHHYPGLDPAEALAEDA